MHTGKEVILKPDTYNNTCTVTLCVMNYKKKHAVGRLVAEAFIPNPENKPCVWHKDENKSNNNVDNLKWMTRKEINSPRYWN